MRSPNIRPVTEKSFPRPARVTLTIATVVTVAGVLMAARPVLIDAASPAMASQRGSVGYHLFIQAGGLLLAALTLLATYRLSGAQVRAYWGRGHLAAPAGRVRWLGIRDATSWRRVGPTMLVWISLPLAAFLYLGLAEDLSRGPSPALLLVAVAFALSNAVAEEAVFRLSLVGALRGVATDRTILALGAGIFGVVHYFGVPGGPIGVVMAGFLGWFLTKSILETGGVFWAVLIHFVLDVIIFAFILHL